MKTRLLAAVFVACCLLLCGLILRRQIAAHPLPPEIAGHYEEEDNEPGIYRGRAGSWHLAPPILGALAHQTVAGQLSALKAGDGPKAWGYQSRVLRQNFGSPAQFMQIISSQYPVFARYRRVQYGPILTDKSGQQARALILLEGENGGQEQAVYQLVREGGEFKVNGVRPLPWPDGRR